MNNRQQLLMIQGVISQLPKEDQEVINTLCTQHEELLKTHKENAVLALTVISLKLAIGDADHDQKAL